MVGSSVDLSASTEVVLLKLVSRFRFTLSDNRVEWKLGFTQYPVIPGEGLQLPLTVSHVK